MKPLYIILIAGALFLSSCSSNVPDEGIPDEKLPEATAADGNHSAGATHDNQMDEAFVCIPDTSDSQISQQMNPSDYLESERLQNLLNHVTPGGPPPDGIPPIDEAKYASIEESDDVLTDGSIVFVLEFEDETYVFPQNIMVWHEIVNLKERDVALTYCPLTGSAITYSYPDGLDTTFGTSGNLLSSNLLMYDRATDAYISQIDGIGLNHDLEGVVLNSVPTYWTNWSRVKAFYPAAKVLTDDTGHIRNYSRDPYGSYTGDATPNYYTSDSLYFLPLADDEEGTFHEKYPVIGVKAGNERMAIDPELVKTENEIRFLLGDLEHVAVYDPNLDTIRVYIEQNEKTYNAEYFQVMWFAWFGFYPNTEVMR